MWTIFKVFIEFVTILLMFWVFGHGYRILVPQLGTEPTPPGIGRRSLYHWTAREVPSIRF